MLKRYEIETIKWTLKLADKTWSILQNLGYDEAIDLYRVMNDQFPRLTFYLAERNNDPRNNAFLLDVKTSDGGRVSNLVITQVIAAASAAISAIRLETK